MIEIVANPVSVPNENLQKLLYSRELIKALARQLVAGQVEAHVEMISDFSGEYSTFKDVETCLIGARECAGDYVEDLLQEFRDALHAEMLSVNIAVKAVKFDKEGAIDADVVVG